MAPLTKLEKLLLSEVSAVDDPANEAPGFAVLKAKGGDAMAAEVEAMIERRVADLLVTKAEGYREGMAKTVQAVMEPYTEVIAALVDRIENLESFAASGARKSLEGQEDNTTTVVAKGGNPKEVLGAAFDAVLKGRPVELR